MVVIQSWAKKESDEALEAAVRAITTMVGEWPMMKVSERITACAQNFIQRSGRATRSDYCVDHVGNW